MNEPVPPCEKVLALPDLLTRFARPRDHKVVFTNGCFDLIHRGHVDYLHAARALGEVLVVGLNTDASVTRLKGPGRPLNGEEDRAIVMASLGCVDAVTLFDEDTPHELIAALLPDVLVKGGDYRVDDVVGRKEVEGAGGRVVILPYVEGRSTTGIINKIQGAGT